MWHSTLIDSNHCCSQCFLSIGNVSLIVLGVLLVLGGFLIWLCSKYSSEFLRVTILDFQSSFSLDFSLYYSALWTLDTLITPDSPVSLFGTPLTPPCFHLPILQPPNSVKAFVCVNHRTHLVFVLFFSLSFVHQTPM